MAEYSQISTIKIARPDTPEGYMLINASDYRAGLPQEMYALGLAYDPAVWAPYVEPVLKAPAKPEGDEPPSAGAARGTQMAGRHSASAATPEEKK